MKTVRKVLLVVLVAVMLFLVAFFIVLLGAPHFQGDDLTIVLTIAAFAMLFIFLLWQWKPED
ncbi:hypothetical protein [Phnomibacter sp. MR]|uniref:hypothetical protein n=1 Tax=Phnomibacter sp. MR TaxID=3042318 RepID=UPI003A802995